MSACTLAMQSHTVAVTRLSMRRIHVHQSCWLPGGHNALRVVGGGVARHTELHVITLLQLGVRNVLQLGAVEEQVLGALAGPDEAPALFALPMDLLHLE